MHSTLSASYTKTAKILHWLIALSIIFMLALGWCFDFFPKGEPRSIAIQLHKSLGITILLLSFVRLFWRLGHHTPPYPVSMSDWEKKAASFGHALLYIVMIGMPLSGWAMVSANPRPMPTVLFGVVPWPALPGFSDFDHQKEASDFLRDVHSCTAYILAILVVGHVLAALRHHFFLRDDILLRMMPRRWAGRLNRWRGLA